VYPIGRNDEISVHFPSALELDAARRIPTDNPGRQKDLNGFARACGTDAFVLQSIMEVNTMSEEEQPLEICSSGSTRPRQRLTVSVLAESGGRVLAEEVVLLGGSERRGFGVALGVDTQFDECASGVGRDRDR
jgi:hypothetical protein